LRRPLGLNAQPFVVAENRLPLALPVSYELIRPLRRSVSPHDLQVLEGHGPLDEVGGARIAFCAPALVNQYSE